MIERVDNHTYQPSPANPTCPLRHCRQQKSAKKQFFDWSIDDEVKKALQGVIIQSGPAKPGAHYPDAIRYRKDTHRDAYCDTKQELLRPVIECQSQKREWKVKNSNIKKRHDGHRKDTYEYIWPEPAPCIDNR